MERNSGRISIYALGGLGEVGKNMYCIENEESIIIIDCGVRFPSIDYPGVDYIIPDFSHLKNNRNKVRALFITHGHEDHIGGIPFLIQNLHIPVIYAPKLACALISSRLEEARLSNLTKLVEYSDDDVIHIPYFEVSFFRVTHSIPDSFGIVVDTSEGRIVSTGDFKVDLTPVGPDINLSKMAKLGEEGVDLLLSDSTNAENEGYTPSEKNVLDSIIEIFENANGRLIISTFSSNISRIQQICEVAVSYKRKIAVVGRSMVKAIEIARSFGYIKVPDDTFIDTQDTKLLRNNEVVILCTGSQGEPMAALSRIANGEHKDIHITLGDTVVFSSSAIPGNGLMIDKVVNLLTRSGAEVITNSILNDIHSSGHPAKQELRIVLKLFKPKYFMPMHGEHRMLRIHAELAQTLGIEKDHTFVLDNGDSLILNKHKIILGEPVEHGATYIDGKDLDGIIDSVLEDRISMNNDGMIAIIITIDSRNNEIIDKPIFYNKGLIYNQTKQGTEKLSALILKAINDKLSSKTNFQDIKNIIKQVTGKYVFEKINRKPMIIPVILSKNE